MQNLELYIEGQRVDLFKDESITVTDTLKNVRDIKKIFTAFSQQFSLPASRVNNKIFKHYYNFDIDNGYDARTKKDALIKLNGVDFKKGKIKLNSVSLKFNKAHTYKIVFFGNTVDLKDVIGEDKLNTLTALNSLNLIWNMSTVKSRLQTSQNINDVIAPLITHTTRLYYDSGDTASQDTGNLYPHTGKHRGVVWNQLKYAIRVRKIVEAIETKYGLTFSNDFFTNTNDVYDHLFMWLHRKSGAPEQVVSTGTEVQILETPVDNWTPTSGNTYANMVDDSTLRITSDWDDDNRLGSSTNMQLVIESTDSVSYGIKVYKDGVLRREETELTGNTTMVQGELGIQGWVVSPGQFQTFAAGDWTVSVTHTADKTLTKCRWIVQQEEGGFASQSFDAAPFTAFNQFDFVITEQIPEMKVIDFLTGLFKMFNLVAFEQEDGTIFVNTLDAFNSTGTSYDITEFVDVSSSQSNVALPYSEIIFRFEGLKSFLANAYKEINNEEWGTLRYNEDSLDTKIDGGSYKVELPFEHFMFETLFDINDTTGGTKTSIQWGWSVNKDQQPDKDLPLLFYPIHRTASLAISFQESASSAVSLTSYNVPSNSLSLTASTSTANINFGLMTNEFSGDSAFTGTLFENYYKTYIQDIFNRRNRLLKLKAYLPQKILINYNLNDVFVIDGKEYRINSIKTNLLTNKSDLELIVKI